ncbi:P-loop containing nucleoside triphosphate hydrolase protein, partial [Suillus weaverae]
QLNSKDVITISPTGSGKTLTFWIPLLFNAGGIIIIVTPLNILGEKNQKEAEALGFPAINLCKETASDQVFKDIEKLQYRVITVSPERLLSDSRFHALWKSKKFTEKIFNITFDEGHCISEWGADFRPLYGQLGNIRWYLPDHVSVHVVSATMPPHILADVTSTLRIRSHNVARVTRSNNRPNISLIVEEMKFPRNTMHDLTRVLDMRPGDVNPPPKFMIFTNSRISAEMTCNRLRSDVPGHRQGKILQAGELWGICCTDAAGMGLDLRDIKIIVQWGYTSSLCALMQRLGRGARDPSLTAVGIYLVEPIYFDTYKGKRKRPAVEEDSRQNKKKKGSNSRAGVENDSREEDVDSEFEGGDDGFRDDGHGREGLQEDLHAVGSGSLPSSSCPSETTVIPSAHVQLIPDNLDNTACERFAMYAFINARQRGFCRRRCKPYEMTNRERDLRAALLQWRDFKMVEEDLDGDVFFGPQLIMSNKTLNRIIDLAHYAKLTSPASLLEQTSWCYSLDYGPQIIDLIKSFFPPPPP